MKRINVQKKLDWRLSNLIVRQNIVAKKIEQIKIIMDMRLKNEMSLRKIGKEIGMTGEGIRQILKQFGI